MSEKLTAGPSDPDDDIPSRERDLQTAVYEAFGHGWPLRLWRQNSGLLLRPPYPDFVPARDCVGRFREKWWYVKAGVKGCADDTGILHLPSGPGIRLEIELKVGTRKQTTEQLAFQGMVTRHGGLYILGRSVQQIREELERALGRGGER